MTIADAHALATAIEYIIRARHCLCWFRQRPEESRETRKELRKSLRQIQRQLNGMHWREQRRVRRRADRRRRLETEGGNS